MKSIKPLKNRVLVQILETPEVIQGKIILMPKNDRKSSHRFATVLAMGIEVSMVETGNTVIIAPYSGVKIMEDDSDLELIIINEQDILGIIEKEIAD